VVKTAFRFPKRRPTNGTQNEVHLYPDESSRGAKRFWGPGCRDRPRGRRAQHSGFLSRKTDQPAPCGLRARHGGGRCRGLRRERDPRMGTPRGIMDGEALQLQTPPAPRQLELGGHAQATVWTRSIGGWTRSSDGCRDAPHPRTLLATGWLSAPGWLSTPRSVLAAEDLLGGLVPAPACAACWHAVRSRCSMRAVGLRGHALVGGSVPSTA
jgi:hypothetical protein